MGNRWHVAIAVSVAVALAALSVAVLPWATTYDPWSWIVWGREIAHGQLVTETGPSWKPLPVLFTVPFSFTGDLAPVLWLTVARAGGVLALFAAYAAARRLAGPAAGLVAALALGLNLEFHRTVWLGNSEGLLVAAVLVAVERHFAGAPRAAFAAGVAAALLRPEVWPFLALYALWLMWRDRATIAAIAGVGIGVLGLWLVPELWGSGELLRAAERAQQPVASAATFAPNPALEVVRHAESMLAGPVQALVVAAVAFALPGLRSPAARATQALAALALAWLGLVALMTVKGFSGNPRYVIAPVALACVAAGIGAAASARVVGRLVERAGIRATAGAAVATGLIAAGCAPFVASRAAEIGRRTAVLENQVVLREGAASAIGRLGGRDAVASCRPIAAEDYSVPMLAWMLRLHLSEVGLDPADRGMVFQTRSGAKSQRDPIMPRAAFDLRYRGGPWRVYARCG